MDNRGASEAASSEVTVWPRQEWNRMLSEVVRRGSLAAGRLREQGHRFVVKVLAPKCVRAEDRVPISAARIGLDWRISTRLEMAKLARELISQSYLIGSLDAALPTVLGSIIEGRGLYEYSIGEFLQLYGQFEGKYRLTNSNQTRLRMESLVQGNRDHQKYYLQFGRWKLYPLPYAVRNILAHAGTNPNTLDRDGSEIQKSIDLLRAWIRSET